MKLQVYTMQTPEEALAVAALGVDHVGVTPSQLGLPGEVDLEAARAIVEAVRGRAVAVALSVESDPDAIEAMVRAVRPDILHLCGLSGSLGPENVRTLPFDPSALTPSGVAGQRVLRTLPFDPSALTPSGVAGQRELRTLPEAVRARLPDLPIMQAVSVTGPEALDAALAYQEVVDYLILDTQAPDIPGIGASGATHDWTISREIVRRVRVPVVLAGGLSPENVAEAIRAVQPWGVDSLTYTNRPLPGGGFCKDLERVRGFVEAARDAWSLTKDEGRVTKDDAGLRPGMG
jgi:phosphoribosylanthranilate isomerase